MKKRFRCVSAHPVNHFVATALELNHAVIAEIFSLSFRFL